MPTKRNLLLVDDDEGYRIIVERVLNKLDLTDAWQLHWVQDGTMALDYVFGTGDYVDREQFPRPDVVLLDQRMRKMDGTETLRALKEHEGARSLPVCLMSTSAQRELHELAYAQGATFCVRKPLDFETLRRRLGLILQFLTEVLER